MKGVGTFGGGDRRVVKGVGATWNMRGNSCKVRFLWEAGGLVDCAVEPYLCPTACLISSLLLVQRV